MSGLLFLKYLRWTLPLAACLTIACSPETSETIEVEVPNPGLRATRPTTNQGNAKGAAADGNGDTESTSVSRSNSGSVNRRLSAWYGVRANYDLVYRDVIKFYPDGRYNGCVAFVTSALRRIGVNIPISSNDTESPSLVTRPFSNYLEKNLGWKRIGSATNLQPGDVVFTKDNVSYPGYPAHTYMFHSWANKSEFVAMVIDNQDFKHERNIDSNSGGYNFTPFAYALRAPD